MGVWSEYCLICGGPFFLFDYADDDDAHALKRAALQSELKWLEKDSCGVTEESEAKILVIGEYNSYGGWETKAGNLYDSLTNIVNGNCDGLCGAVGFHGECAMLLKKRLGYSVCFSDVASPIKLRGYGNLIQSDYGGIEKYQGQDFEDDSCLEDGNEWMLFNPLDNGPKNQKNADRIVKIWREIIQKNGFMTIFFLQWVAKQQESIPTEVFLNEVIPYLVSK